MLERDIEKYLVRNVKKMGGITFKFTSPGNAGVPDRIVLIGGKMFFVELKAPGKSVRPLQKKQIDRITAQGQTVYIADSFEWVDTILSREAGEI